MIDDAASNATDGSTARDLQGFLDSLNRIPWFRSVGELIEGRDIKQVFSWNEAWACLQDDAWTSASFHDHVDQAHPAWTQGYDRARAAAAESDNDHWFDAETDAALQAGWDAGGAAFEIATGNTNKSYMGLMEWYRLGHWPCGWDGTYPKGRLIVY